VERNHEEEVKGVVPLTIGVVGREGRDRNPGRFGLRTMERETGIEPATSSLGSWRSTAELLPLDAIRLSPGWAGHNQQAFVNSRTHS
jgi:hypothetical protein